MPFPNFVGLAFGMLQEKERELQTQSCAFVASIQAGVWGKAQALKSLFNGASEKSSSEDFKKYIERSRNG